MASDGIYRVTLDEAIEAMRLTAQDMSVKYKETSLSVRYLLFSSPRFQTNDDTNRQGLAVSCLKAIVYLYQNLTRAFHTDDRQDSSHRSCMVRSASITDLALRATDPFW